MKLLDVLELLGERLSEIEKDLSESSSSDIAVINNLISDTISSGGKRIRPLLLLLTAGLCGYEGALVREVSVIIEYLHTASLLHDDVIDMALYRRGKPNANAVYGNKLTILSGDYLYTKTFLKVLALPGKEYARILKSAVVSMSEGEIFQLIRTGDLNLTVEEYMRIIHGKTAALFSATCECGALLGNFPKGARKNLRDFGLNVGLAFQIKDDILDYFGNERSMGKKPGADLHEKKVTLPIILLLKESGDRDKRRIAELFSSEDNRSDRLCELLNTLNKYDIKNKANAFVKQKIDIAAAILTKFSDSVFKEALYALLLELYNRDE